MNITIERKKATDCNTASIPKGWHRDDPLGKNSFSSSSGKVDVYYYGPNRPTAAMNKVDTSSNRQQLQAQIRHHHQQQQQQQQQQLQHHQQQQLNTIMDKYDISGYDFQNNDNNCNNNINKNNNNQIIQNIQQVSALQRCASSTSLKRKLPVKTSTITATTITTTQPTQLPPPPPPSSSTSIAPTTTLCNPSSNSMSSQLRHHLEFSRGLRTDVSLVPPIRQTASIFKQPVTVYKTQDSKVKHDLKHGIIQDKPKQLFWEKRLEGLRSCDINGTEFNSIDLPKTIKSVGPNINEQTLLQSIATALHVSNQPITGQTASKTALLSNSGVFLNPEQPLMYTVTINDDDIRKQEDRVNLARRRLQDVLKG